MAFDCNEAFENYDIYFPMNASGHMAENWHWFFQLFRGYLLLGDKYKD